MPQCKVEAALVELVKSTNAPGTLTTDASYVEILSRAGVGVPFAVDGEVVGIVPRKVIPLLEEDPAIFIVRPQQVEFQAPLSTFESRTSALSRVTEKWRQEADAVEINSTDWGAVDTILATVGPRGIRLLSEIGGDLKETNSALSKLRAAIAFHWRNEKLSAHSVSGPPAKRASKFHVERAAAGFFGIQCACTFLICFTKALDGTIEGVWVARRSLEKQVAPGLCDTTAAGAIPAHLTVEQSLAEEALQEANLDPEYVIENASKIGTVSWVCAYEWRGIDAWLGHVFELELDRSVVPLCTTGEVDCFMWLTPTEVQQLLLNEQFGPANALGMMLFMTEHELFTKKDGVTPLDKASIARLRRLLAGSELREARFPA